MTNLPTYSSGINCEDDCNCPGCSPAGDLFMPPSEVNPRRRIIRARRPPQSDPNNLSSAIGFLQQANNNNNPSSTTTTAAARGVQRSGEVSDSDDESMPPLEDIDNTTNSATISTARRGRNNGNNGSSNRNRFGALGKYKILCSAVMFNSCFFYGITVYQLCVSI